MKHSKWICLALVLLLAVGILPLTAVPAFAAEETFTIVGWEVDGPAGSVLSVSLEGQSIPATGASLGVYAGGSLDLTIGLKDGFVLGQFNMEAGFRAIALVDAHDTSRVLAMSTNQNGIRVPNSSYISQYPELKLIICTEEEYDPSVPAGPITVNVPRIKCGTTVKGAPQGSMPSFIDASVTGAEGFMYAMHVAESADSPIGYNTPTEDVTYKGGDTAYVGFIIIAPANLKESDITVKNGSLKVLYMNEYEPPVNGHAMFAIVASTTVKHSFGPWETTKQPTSTESGMKQRVCEDCGHVQKQKLPALGKLTITVPAIECGSKLGSDGEFTSISFPVQVSGNDAYELDFSAVLIEDEGGFLGFKPLNGIRTYNGGNTAYIGVQVYVPTPAFTESDIKVSGGTIAAFTYIEEDEEEEGVYYIAVVIRTKVKHVPGEPETEEEAATCTEPGTRTETVKCTVCGRTVSTKEEEIPAAGHDWDEWETVTEPTETEAGLKRRVCKTDETHVEEEEIPALGEEEPEKKTAVITFDLCGGTLDGKTGTIEIEAEVGSEITIPGAPTKKGYKFLYWKGSKYNPGDKYTVTEEGHAFEAVWENDKPSPKPDDDVPTTGDENRNTVWIWAAVMVVAVIGIAAATILLTKRGKRTSRHSAEK